MTSRGCKWGHDALKSFGERGAQLLEGDHAFEVRRTPLAQIVRVPRSLLTFQGDGATTTEPLYWHHTGAARIVGPHHGGRNAREVSSPSANAG
jgi:hypothetical protein